MRARRARQLIAQAGRGHRGTVYLLVLGVSSIITVMGLSAISVARIKSRQAARSRDWAEAGVLAISAAEFAAHTLATDGGWRKVRTSGAEVSLGGMGSRGLLSYVVEDSDASLVDDYFDTVRVRGIGRVGETVRCYSFEAVPASDGALDVLRCIAHSASSVTATGPVTLDGGPLSCNGNVSISGTIVGNIEAASVSGLLSNLKGTAETPSPAKQMPGASVFDLYADMATSMPWGSIPSGTLKNRLIAMPDGTGNGVYSIVVPGGSTLTIEDVRIRGTLVVTLGTNAKLKLGKEILWEAPRPDFPILVVKGGSGADVDLECTSNSLSENTEGVNFNPTGVPYASNSDADLWDSYPCELRGVIHVIGSSASTTLRGDTRIVGSLICEGSLSVSTDAVISSDELLIKVPPLGYTDAKPGTMRAMPGTWTWDEAP